MSQSFMSGPGYFPTGIQPMIEICQLLVKNRIQDDRDDKTMRLERRLEEFDREREERKKLEQEEAVRRDQERMRGELIKLVQEETRGTVASTLHAFRDDFVEKTVKTLSSIANANVMAGSNESGRNEDEKSVAKKEQKPTAKKKVAGEHHRHSNTKRRDESHPKERKQEGFNRNRYGNNHYREDHYNRSHESRRNNNGDNVHRSQRYTGRNDSSWVRGRNNHRVRESERTPLNRERSRSAHRKNVREKGLDARRDHRHFGSPERARRDHNKRNNNRGNEGYNIRRKEDDRNKHNQSNSKNTKHERSFNKDTKKGEDNVRTPRRVDQDEKTTGNQSKSNTSGGNRHHPKQRTSREKERESARKVNQSKSNTSGEHRNHSKNNKSGGKETESVKKVNVQGDGGEKNMEETECEDSSNLSRKQFTDEFPPPKPQRERFEKVYTKPKRFYRRGRSLNANRQINVDRQINVEGAKDIEKVPSRQEVVEQLRKDNYRLQAECNFNSSGEKSNEGHLAKSSEGHLAKSSASGNVDKRSQTGSNGNKVSATIGTSVNEGISRSKPGDGLFNPGFLNKTGGGIF